MDPSQSELSLVKEDLLQKHAVLPLFKRGGKLFVGTADPTNTHALDEIKFHTNLVVEPILVDEDAIRINLERWLQAADAFGDALDDAERLENLDIDSGEEEDRKSTRLNPVTNAHQVCRLLLETKTVICVKKKTTTDNINNNDQSHQQK